MNLILTSAIFCLIITKLNAMVKFTNVKCTSLDPSFTEFRYCNLKVPQRGKIAMNVYMELKKPPINNWTAIISLQKRANGYRPFLYNYTIGFCKFMSNKNRSPLSKIIYDMQVRDTNVNHTCPYEHDIIVNNFILREDSFYYLPLPTGDYLFAFKSGLPPGQWKVLFNVYFSVVEEN